MRFFLKAQSAPSEDTPNRGDLRFVRETNGVGAVRYAIERYTKPSWDYSRDLGWYVETRSEHTEKTDDDGNDTSYSTEHSLIYDDYAEANEEFIRLCLLRKGSDWSNKATIDTCASRET